MFKPWSVSHLSVTGMGFQNAWKLSLLSVKKTFSKEGSLPSVKKKHSAKTFFVECFFYTRQRIFFVECFFADYFFLLSAKRFFIECWKNTLGKKLDSYSASRNFVKQQTWPHIILFHPHATLLILYLPMHSLNSNRFLTSRYSLLS